jgi:hypothetical protein
MPWRPQKRMLPLLAHVHAVLDEYYDLLPMTARQVYYRLIGAYGYTKSDTFERSVYRVIDRARRARPLLLPDDPRWAHLGPIAFNDIRDDGITVGIDHCYVSIEDFRDETMRRARRFRLDRQLGQRDRLEVWCEAAGMLGQLHRVTSEYGVPVYSNGGANSSTGNWQVSRRALEFKGRTLLLHVGDFDPHGEAIFNALANDVAAFVEADRTLATQRVEAVRVALTVEQVERHGLPTDRLKKPKPRDQAARVMNDRWRERYGDRTAQLEALPPDVLADIVREAVEARMDLDVWRACVEMESRDRAELLGLPAGEDDA